METEKRQRSSHLNKYGMLIMALLSGTPYVVASSYDSGEAAFQQNSFTVKGVVLDENGETLIGVNILEKGTTNGTITDFDGNFTLNVSSKGAVLVASYIGYNDKEVKVEDGLVKIVMKEATELLEEVVVVGYGAQKKESVVGSIAQVTGEKLKSKGSLSNLTDALSGAMPGVTVMTTNGTPGGGGEYGVDSQILIRGMNTWNNAQPLILVDGVERSMNDVDVNEIESFSVLKDASATAVFGVKGANGVILINTKRGEKGKTKVTAEANVSIKSLSKVEKPMDSYTGRVARNYAIVSELPLNGSQYWQYFTTADELELYRNQSRPEEYTNVDWQDYMLKDAAYSTKYNVNISGGTDFVRYFTSLGYVYDGDIFDTDNKVRGYKPQFRYDRFNFRTNLDFNFTKTTQFKVNLSGYYGKQQSPANGIHNMWYSVYKYSPSGALPVYSDGTFGDDYDAVDRLGFNGLFYMVADGTKVRNRTSITTDFELQQKLDFITKGLSIKGKFSFDNYFTSEGQQINDDISNYQRKIFDTNTGQWVYDTPATGNDGFDFYPDPLGYTTEYMNATTANQTRRNMYYEVSLSYNRRFGVHNLGALALFSRQEYATGSAWPSKREDWVGRITYDYDGKYLAEVNAAYNGSEKFGPGHKFDLFPSLAVGWRVSEEKFMKEHLPFVSNLKLKYSIGLVGNDNLTGVGQWPYITTWDAYVGNLPNFGYPSYKATQYPIYMEGTPGNPDLRWEKARKQNYGIELGVFNNLITANIDVFNEYRYDMLVGADDRSIPDFFGHTAPAANIGEIKSHGAELEFKIQKQWKDWGFWGGYSWTVAKNKILYKEDPELKPDYQKQAGYAIEQVKTNVVTGIIDSWDDMYTGVMFENASSNTTLLPGQYRLLDYNADGIINNNDATAYGYSRYPQNTYGFSFGVNYKGWSLSCQFYGTYNVSINAYEISEFDYNSDCVYERNLLETWTPEYNGTGTYRALSMTNKGATGSSVYYDGSFLRLKTAELSYTFPKKWIEKLSISNLRLYVNGNNLFFWSDLPMDIEGNNFTLKSYPNTKQINFGANISF